MPDPRDYVASSLVNGEDEDYSNAQWMWSPEENRYVRPTPGGQMGPLMGGTPGGEVGPVHIPSPEQAVQIADPEAEAPEDPLYMKWLAEVRQGNLDAAAVLARGLAPGLTQAADIASMGAHPAIQKPIGAGVDAAFSMSPEERARKGLIGQVRAGVEAASNTFGEEVVDPIMGRLNEVGDVVLGTDRNLPDDEGQNIVPPDELLKVADEEPSEKKSRLGYRDGVFTNIGVSDDEASAYAGGVADFREDMRAHQAGLGPPPPDRINLSGGVSPGGHMLGDPDAPLPGDPDYAEGGFVSKPNFADPTQALTEEGWKAMTPGAKDEYLRQVGEVSGARVAQSEGEIAQEQARRATDPEYAVRQRFGPYFTFYQMGEDSTKDAYALGLQEFAKAGLEPGTPEYNMKSNQLKEKLIQGWLNEKFASVANWDEVFAKSQGLTFS